MIVACASRSWPAHPRAGGENPRPRACRAWGSGSSPRGRGKLDVLDADSSEGRLIPARAGKTIAIENGLDTVQAHPRAGGENARRKAIAHD